MREVTVQSGCHSGEGRNLSAKGESAFGGKTSKQDASLRWHDTYPERLLRERVLLLLCAILLPSYLLRKAYDGQMIGNYSKHFGFFKRFTSFLLALVFSFQSVVSAAPWAQPAFSLIAPPFAHSMTLKLAPDLGKLGDIFVPADSPRGAPMIYLVEDAHDSLDAQASIRRILKHLTEENKVSRVLFEGGSRELDRQFYRFTPDSSLNRKVWDELLSAGAIGGLERCALEAPQAIQFFGIEDEHVYFDHVQALARAYAAGDKARSAIQIRERELRRQESRLITGELKKIYKAGKTFRAGKLSLARYVRQMTGWAHSVLKLDLSSSANQFQWPELVRMTNVMILESRLANERSKIETSLAQIQSRTPENLKWLWQSARHYLAQGRLRWYFERIYDALPPRARRLMAVLSDWIGYHTLRDELHPQMLMQELRQLEKHLFARMNLPFETGQFLAEERQWAMLRKLMQLELTRGEWREMQLRIKNEKLKIKNHSPFFIFNSSLSFYRLASRRDAIFCRAIQRHLSESGNMALIIGGFHTEAITAYLKENGVGYAVIHPSIHDRNRTLNYRERMTLSLRGDGRRRNHTIPRELAPAVAGALDSAPRAQLLRRHLRARARQIISNLCGASLGHPGNRQPVYTPKPLRLDGSRVLNRVRSVSEFHLGDDKEIKEMAVQVLTAMSRFMHRHSPHAMRLSPVEREVIEKTRQWHVRSDDIYESTDNACRRLLAFLELVISESLDNAMDAYLRAVYRPRKWESNGNEDFRFRIRLTADVKLEKFIVQLIDNGVGETQIRQTRIKKAAFKKSQKRKKRSPRKFFGHVGAGGIAIQVAAQHWGGEDRLYDRPRARGAIREIHIPFQAVRKELAVIRKLAKVKSDSRASAGSLGHAEAVDAVVRYAITQRWITPAQVELARRMRGDLLGNLKTYFNPAQLQALSALYQRLLQQPLRQPSPQSSPLRPSPQPPPPSPKELKEQAVRSYEAAIQAEPGFSPHAASAFEKLEELGRGGMGEVHRVRDRRLGREAALKRMLDPDRAGPEALFRFNREARITAGLNHPYIPPVYEAGTDLAGHPFMLMRVIEGKPLSKLIESFHKTKVIVSRPLSLGEGEGSRVRVGG
ncbi:MAG: hypothetical protein HY586_07575, partial [Candidatus Omnitrophica bacterium]|nr:hypothetical protein [Candidatus Omnitrophota bacterium]